MAETDTNNSNTQRRRSKILVTGGVGGIAGVLIIGGVVAVASLLRNRASKKERDVNNPKTPSTPQELNQTGENEEEEGLRSLIQTIQQEDYVSGAASSPAGCDPEPEETLETPTMEHKPYIEESEEMHTSSTHQKHTAEPSMYENSSNSYHVSEAIKDGLPALDNDGVLPTNDSRQLPSLPLTEDSHQLPSLPLHEETSYSDDYTDDHEDNQEDEDDEDDAEDDESEEEEASSDEDEDEPGREWEGSEWTGDSSIGSHSEAIWPADSIEKELLLFKNRAPGNVLGETISKEDSEKIAKGEEDDFELMTCLATKKDSGSRPLSVRFKFSFSMMMLLVVGLLYLLFAYHLPLLYHSEDSQLSSSI